MIRSKKYHKKEISIYHIQLKIVWFPVGNWDELLSVLKTSSPGGDARLLDSML